MSAWLKSEALRPLLVVIACGALISPARALDKAFEFTPFASLDSSELAGGNIKSDNVSSSGVSTAMAAQTIFFIEKEPSKVAQTLLNWNPTSHSELGILKHVPFKGAPVNTTFNDLSLSDDRSETSWMISASKKVTSSSDDLNLGEKEILFFKNLSDNPASIAEAWKKVLLSRAQTFATSGATALSPYVSSDGNYDADSQMKKLLNQNPKIAAQFKNIIDSIFEAKNNGVESAYYWEKLKADKQLAFNLGVTLIAEGHGGWQVVDYQYYASSSYYSNMILYQIAPATVEGKNGSIVWRGDFVLTPGMARVKGVERMFGVKVLIQEIRKSIEYLRQDIAK